MCREMEKGAIRCRCGKHFIETGRVGYGRIVQSFWVGESVRALERVWDM